MSEQDRRIAETIEREQGRLRNFIRKRVPDRRDVEDVLQDVFFELVEAYRLMKPIEQVGAWLFRVARNRIIDRFRKKRPESSAMTPPSPDYEEDGDAGSLEDLLPSPDAGPGGGLRPRRAPRGARRRPGRAPRGAALRVRRARARRHEASASSRRKPASASTRFSRASTTRCLHCAADFRTFTTNSRRNEDGNLEKASHREN